MVISHSKKFLFLHCRKTAGTYVSSLLYNFLEKNDLVLGTLEDIYNSNKFKVKNHLDFLKFEKIDKFFPRKYKPYIIGKITVFLLIIFISKNI